MPISGYFGGHGTEVMRNMTEEYGPKKGKSVFYATANKRGETAEDAMQPVAVGRDDAMGDLRKQIAAQPTAKLRELLKDNPHTVEVRAIKEELARRGEGRDANTAPYDQEAAAFMAMLNAAGNAPEIQEIKELLDTRGQFQAHDDDAEVVYKHNEPPKPYKGSTTSMALRTPEEVQRVYAPKPKEGFKTSFGKDEVRPVHTGEGWEAPHGSYKPRELQPWEDVGQDAENCAGCGQPLSENYLTRGGKKFHGPKCAAKYASEQEGKGKAQDRVRPVRV